MISSTIHYKFECLFKVVTKQMAYSYWRFIIGNIYLKLFETIIAFAVNRVHYDCVFISKNADAYLYTSCALILKHEIIPVSRELLCYFRLLSHRHINAGRIQMHTSWSKARVEHLPSDTHTRDLSLLQLNVVPILRSASEAADLLVVWKESPHETSCFHY